MILPEIIYDDFDSGYFSLSKFRYDLFLGFTAGLGPVYVFFKYHDSELRKIYMNR